MLTFRRFPKTTLIASLICSAFAFSVVAFALLRLIQAPTMPPQNNISTVSGIMQGVVASAVALAGAIATIHLAVLGINLVEEQSRRDHLEQALRFVGSAHGPFLRVAITLSDVINSAESMYFELSAARNKMIESPREDVMSQQRDIANEFNPILSHHVPQIDQRLTALSEAIRDLWRSPEAVALCRVVSCQSRYNSLTHQMHPNWDEGFSISGGPGPVLSALDSVKERLDRSLDANGEDKRLGFVLCFVLFQKAFHNLNVGITDRYWHFLFSSFLLLPLDDFQIVTRGEAPLKNFGAALLLDIADVIPTPKETEDFMRSHFFDKSESRELPAAVKSYVQACSPSGVLQQQTKELLAMDLTGLLVGESYDYFSQPPSSSSPVG